MHTALQSVRRSATPVAFLLLALAVVLPPSFTTLAQAVPPPPAPPTTAQAMPVIGEIERLTLNNPADVWSGGTIGGVPDLWRIKYDIDYRFSRDGLSPGTDTVVVTSSGTRSPTSSGSRVDIDALVAIR